MAEEPPPALAAPAQAVDSSCHLVIDLLPGLTLSLELGECVDAPCLRRFDSSCHLGFGQELWSLECALIFRSL